MMDKDTKKKLKIYFIMIVGIVGGFLTLHSSCSKYPHDNVIEEFVEDNIENEIGLDIDLTPSSPERNK